MGGGENKNIQWASEAQAEVEGAVLLALTLCTCSARIINSVSFMSSPDNVNTFDDANFDVCDSIVS